MIPFAVAVQVTNATVFDAQSAPHTLRIVTDTRALEVGDTFLALRGETFDGHRFVEDAFAKGAALAIVDDANARVPGKPTLVVAHALRAYMALAGAARAQFTGRVVAITGSAGKTTTKTLLTQLLATRYGERVIASPANENNEIGVSRVLLAASHDHHDVIVVEMGARHPGDIAALVAIAKPHIGILTNVGDAHLEIMGSRKNLEDAKWALFGEGASAILNASDAVSRTRYPLLANRPHWFAGLDVRDELPAFAARATTIVGNDTLYDIDGTHVRERHLEVRLPGAHNRANLAAAIAGACELDVELDAIVAAVPTLVLPQGRYESYELPNHARLIYDAYNANAGSTIAALDAFAQEPAERRVAVLGSMAELGDEAVTLHASVGEHAAKVNVDVLLVGGEFANDLARGALNAGFSSERIVHYTTNVEAARWLREHSRAGDVVLLKGSRKYALEEIVEALLR